ncbi:MAG: nucleotidyltransferase family protein [Candidatus Omnitrophica bacterium]|nr:nucleotidyltransferase family protein [Candidatus Omnitrophota bacterium]
MVSGVLLTAGESSRFGFPKALASFNGKPLIQHLQKTLIASQLDEIIVVVGAESDLIKPYILKHKKVKIVYNKNYKFGQTSSFKCGLNSASLQASAVMLFPVDCPFIHMNTVNKILAAHHHNDAPLIIPTHAQKKGHPPLFNTVLRKKILSLNNNEGINSIAPQIGQQLYLLPVDDNHILTTFNTRDEWESICRTLLNNPEMPA